MNLVPYLLVYSAYPFVFSHFEFLLFEFQQIYHGHAGATTAKTMWKNCISFSVEIVSCSLSYPNSIRQIYLILNPDQEPGASERVLYGIIFSVQSARGHLSGESENHYLYSFHFPSHRLRISDWTLQLLNLYMEQRRRRTKHSYWHHHLHDGWLIKHNT